MKIEECQVGMKVKANFPLNEKIEKVGTISAVGMEHLFVVFPHKDYEEGMELTVYPGQVDEYKEEEVVPHHTYKVSFCCEDGASVQGCLSIDGVETDTVTSSPAPDSDEDMMEAFTTAMVAMLTKLANKQK